MLSESLDDGDDDDDDDDDVGHMMMAKTRIHCDNAASHDGSTAVSCRNLQRQHKITPLLQTSINQLNCTKANAKRC